MDAALVGLLVRWGVALACAVVAGCSHSMARVEHAPSSKGQIAARVTSIDGTPRGAGNARVMVAIDRSLEQTRLLGASVRPAHALPCTGIEAQAWSRGSGVRAAEPWLLAGQNIALALQGSAIELVASSASKLDLLVRLRSGEVRCIPVTISESAEGLTFEPVRRFTLGLDLGGEGYTQALGSVTQNFMFTLVAGAWIDRVHAHVGAGIGGAACKDTRCPIEDESSESTLNESTSYQLLAGADTVLVEGGEFGLGAGLQYRVQYLTADTFVGEDAEEFWAHGPTIAPALLVVWPVIKPHEIGGSRAAMIAFEIPIGYLMAGDRGNAVTIGFNMRVRFTVL